MSFFVTGKHSRSRQREAENARKNREEIVKALSTGQISRRDLLKAGIITAGGLMVPIHGLSPYAKSAYAGDFEPTGTPTSPFPRRDGDGNIVDTAFVQPLLRLHNLTRHPLTRVADPARPGETKLVFPGELGEPDAFRRANTNTITHTVNLANAANNGNVSVSGTTGPQEGRAPGEAFSHQRWSELVNGATGPDGTGTVSNPLPPVGAVMSIGQIVPGLSYNLANNWQTQNPESVWTFGEGRFVRGSLPPVLLQARYGESVINRIYNNMPFFDAHAPGLDCENTVNCGNTTNGGFGRQEPSIHNHNGHNGAESDGAGNAHFFPGQYFDYHFSLMLARRDAGLVGSDGRNLDQLLRIRRGDARASTPTDTGGIIRLPGDFREIQGTLWFHDHRISYTSENVYKGFAALLEYFSGPDRGYERSLVAELGTGGGRAASDAVNLRLPSGWRNGKTWGNRDFDVYLAIQDVSFKPDGQLFFDIFETKGFVGDVLHVNYQWKPTFKVLPRKYRFRTLSAGMSRWIKLCISDGLDATANQVPITSIANDGNLHPQFVRNLPELDIQATAERYDFVIDFSQGQNPASQVGRKYYLVNMLEHATGEKFSAEHVGLQGLREVLDPETQRRDPCLGAIMEFEVVSEVESIDAPGVLNTIANACGANDQSRVNDPGLNWLIPTVTPTRTRIIELTRGADGGGLPFDHPEVEGLNIEPWGVKVTTLAGSSQAYQADMRRVSNLPRPGDVEHWTIKTGKGWNHPMHLHFEEAKTIGRAGAGRPLHPTEAGKRKDVWHVGTGVGNVVFQCQFGEFGGAYVNHCHNTVHEDNAMLLRYDLIKGNSNSGIDDVHITVLPTPDPRPEGVTYVDSCYLEAGNPQGFDVGATECTEIQDLGDGKHIGEVVESTDPRTQ